MPRSSPLHLRNVLLGEEDRAVAATQGESETRGIVWLHRIATQFDRVVWINPDPVRLWGSSQTCRIISRLFPLFYLSVDGIADAVTALGRAV